MRRLVLRGYQEESYQIRSAIFLVCKCTFARTIIRMSVPKYVNFICLSFPLQAGMVEEMNAFASRFMSESEKREEIISEASAVADGHKDPK